MRSPTALGTLTLVLAGGIAASVAAQHHHGLTDNVMARLAKQRREAIPSVDPEKIVHRVLLHPDGGAIDLSARDLLDQNTLDAIRVHLKQVEVDFDRGHLTMPHAIAPAPGVTFQARATHVGMHGAPLPATTPAPPEVRHHQPAGSAASWFVPGAARMAHLKSEIRYRYEETARGARVNITTSNPEAVTAVHAFLRFQIAEHRTGDTGEVVAR